MSEYDKPSGALFINQNKVQGSRQPDYTGNVELDKETIRDAVNQVNNGAKFARVELGGWNKVGPRAGDFISLKASPPKPKKEEGATASIQQAPAPTPAPTPAPAQDVDDKIPF